MTPTWIAERSNFSTGSGYDPEGPNLPVCQRFQAISGGNWGRTAHCFRSQIGPHRDVHSTGVTSPAAAAADSVKVGKERIVASGPLVGQPRSAFGDGVYLVVWQDGSAGVGAESAVKGLRLRPGTLEPIDDKPLLLGPEAPGQESPAVAHADGAFLVVWQDVRNGKDADVRGVLVEAKTGRVGKEIEIAVRPGSQARPAVASDGKTFFVVWQEIGDNDTYGVRGTRISAAGMVLDAEAHEYAASGTSPSVCASGASVLVAWSVRDRNRATTRAALVDPATGRKAKDLGTISTCCGDAPATAHDGAKNFVAVAARAGAPDRGGGAGRVPSFCRASSPTERLPRASSTTLTGSATCALGPSPTWWTPQPGRTRRPGTRARRAGSPAPATTCGRSGRPRWRPTGRGLTCSPG